MIDKESQVKIRNVQVSRDIVSEMLNFGINEEQKMRVIYFLSLELENTALMKDIYSVVRNYLPELETSGTVEKPRLQI